jgi:hypothetical protein
MHMITECVEYTAVRQCHSHLFDCLGGWQHVTDGRVLAHALKQFMSHEQHLVAAFLVDCSQRRWANPPAELLEGLGDGGLDVDGDAAIVAAVLADAADLFPEGVLEDVGVPVFTVVPRVYWRMGGSQWVLVGWMVVRIVVGVFVLSLALCFLPCSWCMPYEPSLARALGARERAVRRGPDPV